MTEKDTQDILHLIYHANCCQDMDSFIFTICTSMMQIFRSECTTFHVVKGYPQHINIDESRSFKNDSRNIAEDKYYPALYKDGYFHQSPLLKTALSSPKTVLKIQDSLSQKDWENSDMYNDFIKPQHLFWELFLPLRWKSSLKGVITLWRPRNQPDFEISDILKSEMLSPHLSLAIRNISRISKVNNLEKQSISGENANNEGLILLDDKLQLVYSNVIAREICIYLFNRMSSGTFDLNKGEFPIPHCVISDCYDLLNTQKTDEQLEWLPKERVIFTKNGKKFRIECSLIWKTNKEIATPQFMVTFADLTRENTFQTALQVKFHLTHREVEVIFCILADMSYDDIAENLFISKLTVHTHVKNIYRKLGVKNRIELFKCIQYPLTLK
ncbi:MAG: LuxR C-terminal-related transcriptional regulator [Dehalococcoidales bacterium]|nr:LuxR C-terminal-related transcriptional regulator [Dehalococcoidales bacterium]